MATRKQIRIKYLCKGCKKQKTLSSYYHNKVSGKRNRAICISCVHKERKGQRLSRSDQLIELRQLKRRNRLRLIYGVDPDDTECDRCWICNRREKVGSTRSNGVILTIDHDHKTGKFRGILCRECNFFLGFYEKNRERIQGMEAYLVQTRRSSVRRKNRTTGNGSRSKKSLTGTGVRPSSRRQVNLSRAS